MEEDEIMKEARAVREAYAEGFGFDLPAIFRDAMERQEKSGRQLVAFGPKRITPSDGPTKRS